MSNDMNACMDSSDLKGFGQFEWDKGLTKMRRSNEENNKTGGVCLAVNSSEN
jgi:hypothetical protein